MRGTPLGECRGLLLVLAVVQVAAAEPAAGDPMRVEPDLLPPDSGIIIDGADAGVGPTSASQTREPIAVVADEAVGLDEKLAALREAARVSDDLSALVAVTRPRTMRGALCREAGDRVRMVAVKVRAKDTFGRAVTGKLVVDGRPWGTLPFKGDVPACAQTISAADVGTKAPVERQVDLELEAARDIELKVGGRELKRVLSLLGDFNWAQGTPLVPGVEPGNVGGGLRYDAWNVVTHFSLALRVTPAKGGVRTDNIIYTALTLGPAIDLFFGWGSAIGERDVDHVRAHWAIDVGIAGEIVPTIRASLALSLFDHAFLTLGADLRVNPVALVSFAFSRSSFPGKNVFEAGVLFPGLTVALGYGF